MSRHNCGAASACQHRTPACLGCEHHALAQFVQASRDTGCCVPFGDCADTEPSLTPFERIAYWGAVGLSVGCSLVVVFGTAGYLFTKLI